MTPVLFQTAVFICSSSKPTNDLGMGGWSVGGNAWAVTYQVTKPVKRALVTLVEYPGYSCVTDAHGRYCFTGLGAGMKLTLSLSHPLYTTTRTQTFTMPESDVKNMSFQVPDRLAFHVMCIISKTQPDPSRGHIASTITTRDPQTFTNLGFPGEPGCTDSIEPKLPRACGPVYFNTRTLPKRELTETTTDGGICYVNVPPGEYTLYAHKEGMEFEPVKVKVAPKTLTNAAPPYGLRKVR